MQQPSWEAIGGRSYDYSVTQLKSTTVTQAKSTKSSIIEVKAKIVYFFYEIDIRFDSKREGLMEYSNIGIL